MASRKKPKVQPLGPALTDGGPGDNRIDRGPAPEQLAQLDMDSTDGVSEAISNNPEVARFQIAKRIAHMLANSSLVPDAYRGRPADCFIAIQMGAELGMKPFQAIQSIAVIDGRPGIFGDALIGVVRANPLCEWISESIDVNTKTATCRTKRKGDPEIIERSFSWEQATVAGLIGKDNYRKYPQRMIQMRARAWCLRDAYPDVLKGLGVAEELMDYSDEPAPITNFELPKPVGEEATKAIEQDAEPITYEVVCKAFEGARSMEELLKASNLTKQLSNDGDLAAAREKYRERKVQLQTGTQ